MKVANFNSSNGNPVPNQFLIHDGPTIMFQSYGTMIATKEFLADDTIVTTLDSNSWDYSKTTGKYRNQFLGETKAETLKKIETKEYIMEDLNK